MNLKNLLERILRSRKFKRALREAAEITAETSRETELEIWGWGGRGGLKINIAVGLPYAMADPLVYARPKRVPGWDLWPEEGEAYLSIHFHPTTELEDLCPSPEDLHAFEEESRKGMVAMGVARVGERREIDLLFLGNPPTFYNLFFITEEIERFPFQSMEELLEFFRKWGMSPRLIRIPPPSSTSCFRK